MRRLDFEVVQLFPESLEQVRSLVGISSQDRQKLLEELLSELASFESEVQRLKMSCMQLERDAQDSKRLRRAEEKQLPQRQTELSALKQRAAQARLDCAQLQAHLDKEEQRHYRKLPVPTAKDEDPDLREERRKLRSVSTNERARALHEALVSARQQELDALNLAKDAVATADAADIQVRLQRQTERKLRQELSNLREDPEPVKLSRSQEVHTQDSEPVIAEITKLPDCGVTTVNASCVPAAAPSKPSDKPPPAADEMDDLLYGGRAPPRRLATGQGVTGSTGGLLSRSVGARAAVVKPSHTIPAMPKRAASSKLKW